MVMAIPSRYTRRTNCRLARVVNGTLTTHTLDLGLSLPEVLVEHPSTNPQSTLYLHLPHSTATDDGAWTYSASDGLGSVRQRLDASGQVAAVNDYRPFGSPLAGEGGSPYGFTGEWWEDDAGLLYLRARYLQPEIGRFISRDPWPGQVGRPGTLNRYAYLLNDPINASDPSGRCPPGVPECRDEQGRPIDSYYLSCRSDWPCFFKEQLRGPSDPELFEILQARRLRVRDYRPFCEYARLHPKTEELVKQHASRYGVPWQIVAGVLYAEEKTDKNLTDILGDMFWSRTSWPVTDMAMQYVWPDPGSGAGNVHVTPAQYVSKYFAEHYPDSINNHL
jgi:RHS repeat-associated protein